MTHLQQKDQYGPDKSKSTQTWLTSFVVNRGKSLIKPSYSVEIYLLTDYFHTTVWNRWWRKILTFVMTGTLGATCEYKIRAFTFS